MTVNFIPVDKLGDASESKSTSSVLKMNTLKQSSIDTVLQKKKCYKSWNYVSSRDTDGKLLV